MASASAHAPARPAAKPVALVPAVARAVAVMDLLARQREPLTMAHLASTLALPKSSVHGLCNTLLSYGYLRRADNGALQIGPSVMSLAEAFVASTNVAGEFDALWRASDQPPEETLLLSTLDGADVIYLSARNGTRPLGLAFSRGSRLPAHLAATGRAMLAFSDPAQVRRLLGRGRLPRLTAHGPANVDALLADLAVYRRTGISVDDEHIRLGVYCMAAPVFDAAGRVVAGVGVCLSKPSCNAAEVKRQRQRVMDTARALTARLGGDWAECVQAAQQTEVS